MTEYEQKIVDASILQAKIRRNEEEGSVFPMENDLEVLLDYQAISADCFYQCIRILYQY